MAELEEKGQEQNAQTEKAAAKGQQTVVETANADFDWDSYESNDVALDGAKKEDLEKMYDQTLSTISEKEVIDGTVIAMNKREVVINIGFKSDGIVSRNEFRYNSDLKVGDTVEVYVESQEDKKGQLALSHKKARALRSWDRVNEALESFQDHK